MSVCVWERVVSACRGCNSVVVAVIISESGSRANKMYKAHRKVLLQWFRAINMGYIVGGGSEYNIGSFGNLYCLEG